MAKHRPLYIASREVAGAILENGLRYDVRNALRLRVDQKDFVRRQEVLSEVTVLKSSHQKQQSHRTMPLHQETAVFNLPRHANFVSSPVSSCGWDRALQGFADLKF